MTMEYKSVVLFSFYMWLVRIFEKETIWLFHRIEQCVNDLYNKNNNRNGKFLHSLCLGCFLHFFSISYVYCTSSSSLPKQFYFVLVTHTKNVWNFRLLFSRLPVTIVIIISFRKLNRLRTVHIFESCFFLLVIPLYLLMYVNGQKFLEIVSNVYAGTGNERTRAHIYNFLI